jgi:hypothetical protein
LVKPDGNWEKWEKWFWNNKLETEHEADQGLNAFFVYYWQIKLLQEKQWKNNWAHHSNYDVLNNDSFPSLVIVEDL